MQRAGPASPSTIGSASPGATTRADIELLATVDEALDTLCGPATQRILEHESPLLICTTCAAASATASRAGTPSRHLSRRSRSGSSASLSRRAGPAICAWIRCISAISRGDPGSKGVDHIHAVDIGAAHLGGLSGFINATMSKLRDKPLIEQSKGHPRRSGDNGLIETSNDDVIRKRVRHKRCQALLEPLLGLDKPAQCLRPGNALQRIAGALSDTNATQPVCNKPRANCSSS